MGSDWPIVKLGDYCKKIGSGATPKGGSSVYLDLGDVCLIRSQNIYNEGFSESGLVYIDDIAATKLKNVEVEKNDVLLNITGDSVARVCLAPSDFLPARVNQHVAIIRPNAAEFDARFLRYLLASPKTQKLLLNLASAGATRNALTKGMIEDFEVSKPPVSVQTGIANLLESLDNKITLNRQINQTLEQMAQALFKSWFVDFDPVMDNALDAGNPIPDELQHRAEARQAVRESEGFNPLPDDVRQLFPDAFEESELGWVPKGWEVTMLGDMCVELRRGISPKYIEEGGIKVINQKCIRNHEVNYDLARRNNPELRKVDGREVQLGDVLVNSTGVGTLGRMAQVTYIPEPTVVDSHVTLVRVNSDICPMYTFGQLLLSIENRVERLGEGSTGQTELSRKILSEQQVVLPPLTIANHIEATFKSFADKKVASRNEVDSLTKLRDTLLPKLISGELRLDEVELAVEQEAVSAEQQNER
ncbi:restriction modification system DNA specificity subunit [Vibrio mimicus]|uniref:restriction endonuclease subunit S n=1 Tax=Vibrio mimicus TaxID=674 RepID=UPI000DFB6402|nr:restriction endonuclease subunit S [Vibrio mimicus]MBY7675805.1 restriction endonuclease subunit S [Vibrio mimicus]MBY7727656.1 restriction endonuclease subunit S [Vibrio mimicus]TXY29145.1 restriction endonuclease subunit S [Vibrio mimicus]SUP09064.1 restriction modification system DNA specificity subunit [Vibrio mimicus]